MVHETSAPKYHRPTGDRTIDIALEATRELNDDAAYPGSDADLYAYRARFVIGSGTGLTPGEKLHEINDVMRGLCDEIDDDAAQDWAQENAPARDTVARIEYEAASDECTVKRYDHPLLDDQNDQDDALEIRVNRDAVIGAVQEMALNDVAMYYVVADEDGRSHVTVGSPSPGAVTHIPVDRFVESHNTDTDAMCEDWMAGEFAVSDWELWADAIELRDEIPAYMSPTGEPVRVEYIDQDDNEQRPVTDGGR